MSAIEGPGVPGPSPVVPNTVLPIMSFKQKLALRRKELEADATFELPVPGYEDLWARYKALGYEEVRSIGLRVEEETDDQVTGERLTAAATLAEACVDLLEFKGLDEHRKPTFENLGCRWSWQAGRDLFELDIPEGVAARDVLTMIFPYPRDMLMMNHFEEYLASAMGYLPEIEKILLGESKGRSDVTSSPS